MPDARGTEPATVRAAIADLTAAFRSRGLPSAELDARLLVLDACGLSHEAYLLAPSRGLSSAERAAIASASARRLAREPVSRILGHREFWGRRFALSPSVLDPRPDTETLVETALDILRDEGRTAADLRILDLGTGTGCILLTLLAELPNAWGLGVDRDMAALAIARGNAASLGLTERAAFACSNWADAVCGPFDLVISNPPYIPAADIETLEPEVRCHDPRLALDGGADGLDAYRRIIGDQARVVAPNGWLIFEFGVNQVMEILTLLGYTESKGATGGCKIRRDMAGIERVVAVKRQHTGR
jgi:release factor glutamine methyltransferase